MHSASAAFEKNPKESELLQCTAKDLVLGVPIPRRPLGTDVPGLVVNVDPPLAGVKVWELPLVLKRANFRRIKILALKIHPQDLLLHVIAVGVAPAAGVE